MLTSYERSQLERAVDCIRAGCCPRNLDELAGILEHCLMADRLAVARAPVYEHPASKRMLKAMDKYGLPVADGDTVGALLTAIVAAEDRHQEKVRRRVKRRKPADRAGG